LCWLGCEGKGWENKVTKMMLYLIVGEFKGRVRVDTKICEYMRRCEEWLKIVSPKKKV
jgi:hypothetical protein